MFANILLADEINRTPPKTQAALLEAMQERQVSSSGTRHPLPDPFFVLATQNPIEQEGTYPLPEAQLDRFLFKVFVGYPSPEEERLIYRRTTGSAREQVERVLAGDEIPALQELVRRVPISDHTLDYAMALVRATRTGSDGTGLHGQMDLLGRGAAGRPGADSGGQGQGGARRPHVGHDRRHPGRGPPGAAAPAGNDLFGPGRRTDSRHDHQRAARDIPARTGLDRTDGHVSQILRS